MVNNSTSRSLSMLNDCGQLKNFKKFKKVSVFMNCVSGGQGSDCQKPALALNLIKGVFNVWVLFCILK